MKNQKIPVLFFITFCLWSISNCVFGQNHKQGYMWFFGNHCGLDFTNGAPQFIGNGSTYFPDNFHAEASSAISDSSGSLLFYTNGRKVWNRNHALMPHGDSLLGHWSSTQGALILAQPGSSRYFYIFTTDAFYEDDLQYGFRYSIVDMCLDNGWGDVDVNRQNIKILDTVAEKLTAVRHANGTDYWVIVHKYYSDAFYSYLLTANGIADTAITHIGSNHPYFLTGVGGAIGQMKASADGTKIAAVNGNAQPALVEYFDFDKATGVLSNWVDLAINSNISYYGCSFSPDNSKLYASCWLNWNGIYQFDLNAGGGHPDSVRASQYYIQGSTLAEYGMQLGPDGKIYIARVGGTWLSVIENPNLYGAACNFIDTGIYLNGFSSSYNVTNFIDSYDYSNNSVNCSLEAIFVADNTICPGTCVDFTNLSINALSYQWIFPGANPSTSTDVNPATICYANPGNYDVTLIASDLNGSDTLTLFNYITVFPQPPPQSITQSGDTLFAIPGAVSYRWYLNGNIINGITNYFYIAHTSGDYNVVAIDGNGCEVEAVINNVLARMPLAFGYWPLAIYPNPVISTIDIRGLDNNSDYEIKIYNVFGEKVFSAVDWKPGTVNCELITAGLYYLEILSDKKIYRTKFIKQ